MFNFRSKKGITLFVPGEGQVFPIYEVKDPVFSEKMLGDGFGFLPMKGKILAPCNGEIIHVFPTLHAIALKSDKGAEILMHLGIDTVDLKGKGFTCHVEADEKVKTGQLLIEMDLDYIKTQGKSIICPIIVTNMDDVKKVKPYYYNKGTSEDIALKVIMQPSE